MRRVDVVRSAEDEVLEQLAWRELVWRLHQELGSMWSNMAVVRLFDRVVGQIEDRGWWDPDELARDFMVSRSTIDRWMWQMREAAAQALGEPVPTPRSVRRWLL